MASFTSLIAPKGDKFYDLFESAADNIVEMSRLFQQLAYNSEPTLPASVLAKMEDLEHQNDAITHQVFLQMGRNFITPFDREDIHSLASALDDIADFTWGAARQMKNHHLLNPGDATVVFSAHHHSHTKILAEAVRHLRHTASFSAMSLLLRDLRKSAHQTSGIIDDALIALFSDGKDFHEAMKRVDHYELLHGILDKTIFAVKTMEVIVVKYS